MFIGVPPGVLLIPEPHQSGATPQPDRRFEMIIDERAGRIEPLGDRDEFVETGPDFSQLNRFETMKLSPVRARSHSPDQRLGHEIGHRGKGSEIPLIAEQAHRVPAPLTIPRSSHRDHRLIGQNPPKEERIMMREGAGNFRSAGNRFGTWPLATRNLENLADQTYSFVNPARGNKQLHLDVTEPMMIHRQNGLAVIGDDLSGEENFREDVSQESLRAGGPEEKPEDRMEAEVDHRDILQSVQEPSGQR